MNGNERLVKLSNIHADVFKKVKIQHLRQIMAFLIQYRYKKNGGTRVIGVSTRGPYGLLANAAIKYISAKGVLFDHNGMPTQLADEFYELVKFIGNDYKIFTQPTVTQSMMLIRGFVIVNNNPGMGTPAMLKILRSAGLSTYVLSRLRSYGLITVDKEGWSNISYNLTDSGKKYLLELEGTLEVQGDD